jgi:hypothetical protein
VFVTNDDAHFGRRGGAGLAREELEALIERGLTVGEIAEHVGRSTTTVRRWLGRYGLRTNGASRIAAAREAREDGLTTARLVCRVHGESEFVLDRAGYYRCRPCRVESVTRRRRRVKEILAEEAGGACRVCGYSRYIGALHFHHIDPATKRLGLAMGGVTLGIETLRLEASKCVLLCSNCHAEVEGGVTVLPIE